MKKRDLGQFNTTGDSWLSNRIKNFIKKSNARIILDPYAGQGDLLKQGKQILTKAKVIGYDIDKKLEWKINDSLKSIPFHNNVIVITNPPYYAKVSATIKKRNNVLKYFKNNSYEDLYQIAIEKVLAKYDKAVFIIPETFVNKVAQKQWIKFIEVLDVNPFQDTEVSTCVVVFDKTQKKYNDFIIYKKGKKINFQDMNKFKLHTKKMSCREKVLFNKHKPMIGIRGFDAANGNQAIEFFKIKDFKKIYDINKIKKSSRAYYTASIPSVRKISNIQIKKMNEELSKIRNRYFDVIFSPFKGYDKNGIRRRRLDFEIARYIITKELNI